MAGIRLGAGVADDVRARVPFYAHDWLEGLRTGVRILAPATYIFFASVLPALAFGQQLDKATDGILTGVNVLAATGAAGIVQAIFGEQPLLIVGVAEPIVLLYIFMFDFAKNKSDLGKPLFLAWTAWVCVWTAAMCILLALLNVCQLINWFTRFSGELFGGLIAVLFAQEAIKGWKEQFQVDDEYGEESNLYQWRLVNGLFGVILGLGLVISACFSRTARQWRFGFGVFRSLMADYGAPLMVLFWTLVSFGISDAPEGVPRRLPIPNTWDATGFWTVSQDMGKVPGGFIAGATIPALIITILFFFDHSVSAQLAQVEEFNLEKPSAYHYDFFLLGIITLACGLLGVPPVNGVLPQSPLHTKSLATLKKEHVRSGLRKAALKAIAEYGGQEEAGKKEKAAMARVMELMEIRAVQLNSSSALLIRENLSLVDGENTCGKQSSRQSVVVPESVEIGTENGTAIAKKTVFDVEKDIDAYLQVEVAEQRISGLLQSLLVLVCLALTPVLKKIPSAVIYGYFLFMAIESLPGSQFWDRLLLLITDPKRRYRVLERNHAPYLQTVRFRTILSFTSVQLLLLAGVWALTYFAGVAGSLFPLPILALIPIRVYLLPRIFREHELEELDNKTWEEAEALPHEMAIQEQSRLSNEREEGSINISVVEDEVLENRFTGYIKDQASYKSRGSPPENESKQT